MSKATYLRRERMMMAVEASMAPSVAVPSVGDCTAGCTRLEGARKKECENDCEAQEAVAAVAARLRRDLLLSFREIIWAGGDIDPVPDPNRFETAVREKFARTHRDDSPKNPG